MLCFYYRLSFVLSCVFMSFESLKTLIVIKPLDFLLLEYSVVWPTFPHFNHTPQFSNQGRRKFVSPQLSCFVWLRCRSPPTQQIWSVNNPTSFPNEFCSQRVRDGCIFCAWVLCFSLLLRFDVVVYTPTLH